VYLKETKTIVGMGEELENIIIIHFILLLRYYKGLSVSKEHSI